jgi:hypothetical protein
MGRLPLALRPRRVTRGSVGTAVAKADRHAEDAADTARGKQGRAEDARWIARLTEMGMLRSSFVPPPEFRALRACTRHIWDLTADRARYWQRLEKLLEDALCKPPAPSPTRAGRQVPWPRSWRDFGSKCPAGALPEAERPRRRPPGGPRT